MVDLGHRLVLIVSHFTCCWGPGRVCQCDAQAPVQTLWLATCKAQTSLSEQGFHSGGPCLEVQCWRINSCFHWCKSINFPHSLLFYFSAFIAGNTPSLTALPLKPHLPSYLCLISSWWSPQFFHQQTLHLSSVQRCGEKSARRVISASEIFVHLLVTVVNFPVFLMCIGACSGQERERQQSVLTGCGLAQCFVPDISRQIWKPTDCPCCENDVELVYVVGSSSAQGEIRMSSYNILHWMPFSDLQCPLPSQDLLYAMSVT